MKNFNVMFSTDLQLSLLHAKLYEKYVIWNFQV